jgi:hypothetical protein
VRILREVGAGEVVTFGPGEDPVAKVGQIRGGLDRLLRAAAAPAPAVDWAAFEPYTARGVAARFAEALDTALATGGPTQR